MDKSKMRPSTRADVIKLAESHGWQVSRRPSGEDLFDKLISVTNALYPSRVCIDKNTGISKSGVVNYFKVVVHPNHYRADLEDLQHGISAAINQKTKINLHSHSGYAGFPNYPGNFEPCGQGYKIDDLDALKRLLLGLCGKAEPIATSETQKAPVEVSVEASVQEPKVEGAPDSPTNTPSIQKGLVIDKPWIDKILTGEKTWEMRSKNTKQQGWIGLIRKGSGKIYGAVRLVESIGPLSRDELHDAVDKHQIRDEIHPDDWMDKWNHAWVLADVVLLDRPIPYRHPNGAVIWVKLGDDVLSELNGKLFA